MHHWKDSTPGTAVYRLTTVGILLILLSACSDMRLVIPGVQHPLFRDEFVLGEVGPWLLESDENGSTSIVPEQLLIEIMAPDLVQYATLREPELADFSLTVDGRILSGSPQSSYGVLFRQKGPSQFYRFEITGDGMFIVERHDPDGSRVLLTGDWRDSEAIARGLNVVNQLQVDAQGSNLLLSVNEVLVAEVNDDTYDAGTIALDAGTFTLAPVQVAFDNLAIFPPGS